MAELVLDPPKDLAPDDPFLRAAQTFPQLSPEMAERVAGYGVAERLDAGAVLFQRGQRRVDFFLVLEGSVEIIDLDEHGRPHVVTVHRERQFTGELDLFNDREILVTARAGAETASPGSSAPTSAAWSPPSRTSARSSCGPSSCGASG